MKMKKFMAVLAVAGMMTGMLAGCGSSSDDAAAEGGESTESTSEWDASNDITIVSARTDPAQEAPSQSSSALWRKWTARMWT